MFISFIFDFRIVLIFNDDIFDVFRIMSFGRLGFDMIFVRIRVVFLDRVSIVSGSLFVFVGKNCRWIYVDVSYIGFILVDG